MGNQKTIISRKRRQELRRIGEQFKNMTEEQWRVSIASSLAPVMADVRQKQRNWWRHEDERRRVGRANKSSQAV